MLNLKKKNCFYLFLSRFLLDTLFFVFALFSNSSSHHPLDCRTEVTHLLNNVRVVPFLSCCFVARLCFFLFFFFFWLQILTADIIRTQLQNLASSVAMKYCFAIRAVLSPHTHTHTHIYIYIHTHTYTHTHIYINI